MCALNLLFGLIIFASCCTVHMLCVWKSRPDYVVSFRFHSFIKLSRLFTLSFYILSLCDGDSWSIRLVLFFMGALWNIAPDGPGLILRWAWIYSQMGLIGFTVGPGLIHRWALGKV